MKKILILSLVFSPDGVSTATLISELARELSGVGGQITVLTSTPHYNLELEARKRQPLQKKWGGVYSRSDYFGMPVYHASVPQKGEGVGSRLLGYIRFHLISTLVGLFLREKFDLILVLSPPLTIGLSAWIISRVKRIPFVYNVQEIYPDIAVQLGILKNPFIIKLMETIEIFVYQKAHRITVISELFKQNLIDKGVNANKIQVIANFVDLEFILPGLKSNQFSTSQGLSDKFVVLYAGNFGLTQDFETVLSAAGELKGIKEVHFLIVGGGVKKTWLESKIKDEKLDNVTLLPYQPRSMIPDLYAAADVCLIPMLKGADQGTFPSKIYTIMAASKAVIASAAGDSELAQTTRTAENGWVILTGDSMELAETIQEAYQNPGQTRIMGEKGREYVAAKHSPEIIAQQYDDLFREIIEPE